MDWLRRNWPDLLIGVALVAVIAGIIVTLLGGGSVFDFARTRTPAPEPALLQPREPVAPAADEELDEPVSPLVGLREEREEEDEELTEAVVPVSPSDAEEVELVTAEEAVAEEPPVSPLEPEAVLEPEEATVETAATVTETIAMAADANGEPWRVGVGTFRVLSNAEAEAARFRAEGHPTFISQQGDLHVVLVGPFAEEAEARDVAERFRDDGREAIIYLASTPAAAAAQEAAAPAEQAQEPAETPAETESPEETLVATAPATPGYLQVGAYSNETLAEPQRQLMESFGYDVTVRTTDTGLVRLLIGPFSADELAAARSALDAQDIEHYGPVD
jgi:cell division protein FtsN